MARTHERVFAFVMAILFLLTSVVTGLFVLWQIREDNKAKQDNSSVIDTSSTEIKQANEQEDKKVLKGTNLAEFTPIESAPTLQTIDLVVGSGEEVKAGDTITAHYTGAYAVNGVIFESSLDGGSPATFPLSGVIQGWQQGVPGMKVGGKRRLIIPGPLAYGEAPAGYKPGDGGRPLGPLVFDIELVSIGQ